MLKVRAVRLSDETWERLREQANQRGISVSERIRELVDESRPRAEASASTETRSSSVGTRYDARPITPAPKPSGRRKVG